MKEQLSVRELFRVNLNRNELNLYWHSYKCFSWVFRKQILQVLHNTNSIRINRTLNIINVHISRIFSRFWISFRIWTHFISRKTHSGLFWPSVIPCFVPYGQLLTWKLLSKTEFCTALIVRNRIRFGVGSLFSVCASTMRCPTLFREHPFSRSYPETVWCFSYVVLKATKGKKFTARPKTHKFSNFTRNDDKMHFFNTRYLNSNIFINKKLISK